MTKFKTLGLPLVARRRFGTLRAHHQKLLNLAAIPVLKHNESHRSEAGLHPLRRAAWGLAALNPAALWLLLRKGKTPFVDYVRSTVHLFRGYGAIPYPWYHSSWRSDFLVPGVAADELFPGTDFAHAPEVVFPFPRDIGVQLHELILLCQLVRSLRPKRILEFGTAEGRTTINLALHAPEETEVVTVNFPGEGVGFFYKGHSLRSKIEEVLADIAAHDWTPYANSVDFIFCDACDSYEGVAMETGIAFSMIRQGGTILWHDYASGEGRTQFLNRLSQHLPLHNIRGTCLVCLRVNTPALLEAARKLSSRISTFGR